jgi:beta-glucosidase
MYGFHNLTEEEHGMTEKTAAEIVASLTLEEKASLTSGANFWTTKAVERAGIPSIVLTDGPHGVRLQRESADHLGLADSVPATCFPPAVGLGASFDTELLERVGVALGEEAKTEGVGVLLGPGINIKRSPLCGRNFEYLSEDPIVSGILGSALVRGLQSQGVGTSLKHFAANNQEHDRMRSSSDVDPRPLREIYLRGFQRVVEDEQPWTVMCSYNKLNGVYTSENPWLLNTVLRDEWGFTGVVVSDWGAVNDRVTGVAAGLDLEMPSSDGRTDAELVAAVRAGELDEAVLDLAALRTVELALKAQAGADADASYDVDAHHALAREAAARSIVLLKNESELLPLASAASVAIIGEFARTPRYQGAGSSMINPTRLDTALEEIGALADQSSFAAGFTLDGDDSDAAALRDEAVAAAAAADVAVVFLGIPAAEESEGFDREHLELPAVQLELLDAVLAVNPRTVVVLSNGGVVRLGDFEARVPAILEGWLLGQAGGGATADVLYGVVNPSARLSETFPVRLEDSPAFLDFPGENSHVRYGEGLFVGYRWYDARKMAVQYPFGHGLSYTTFAYSGLELAADEAGITATVTVTNTGSRDGREIVQLYTGVAASSVQRAPQELKGFASVALAAGESRTVSITARREDLTYWDTRIDQWMLESGEYTVSIGASSRDIRASGTVKVEGDVVLLPLGPDTSLGEMLADPVAGPILMQGLAASFGGDDAPGAGALEIVKMIGSLPVSRLKTFASLGFDVDGIGELMDAANQGR